ncbi:hypothetical protein SAMN05444394_0872 [Algoriphagus halophilus]|uniref:Uncharacterized protein n=1 Tax=Algoriphagus halophilus TaxID=226505 RepID=A0A1N6DGS7_9BACT|nr:hypothetical protein SAMN05444394_0872 [Algoriphagus halophilus]
MSRTVVPARFVLRGLLCYRRIEKYSERPQASLLQAVIFQGRGKEKTKKIRLGKPSENVRFIGESAI